MSPQLLDEAVAKIESQFKNPKAKQAFLAVMDKVIATKNPFILINEGHLTIKTKGTPTEPPQLKIFTLNKAQRKIFDLILKLWIENKIPIRLWILKARQLGISTLIEAIVYAVTSQQENINSVIISDDADGANYIFEMSKLYHEKCAHIFKQKEKKSNEKKLEFEGTHSQILIDTASNPAAGRKYTFRIAHLSEYAFFGKVKELMLGLSQAVPALPQTMIIKETTANGFNFAKEEWDAAVAGETDYIPIFVPWYWGEDYRMAIDASFIVGDPSLGEVAKAELWLAAKMRDEGIDFIEERLAWRRWCVRNNCENKVADFRQEYPSTDYEAFVASGDSHFDKVMLVSMMEKLPKVMKFNADIVEFNNTFELRRSPDGIFTFYEHPESNGKFYGDFTVAGDAASGSSLDYSCLEACRRSDGKQIATYHGKCDTDEMEQYAYLLASYLNEALVAIENEKFGFAVNKGLKSRYGNLYRQTKITTDGQETEHFGWETNSVTRPYMISCLAEDIRQGVKDINEKQAITECLTFIKNPETKKVEAAEGCNDDWVMCMAINSALRRLHPYSPSVDNSAEYDEMSEHRPNRGYGWKTQK
jgi:hypothetical protein